MLLKGWTPSNIWGFGSLKTSLGRGMLLKSVLTPGELSVWSTDNITSIPVLKLWISCMFPLWDHTSNMLPLYGIPIFKRILTNWRSYKSLHYVYAQRTGWLAVMICLLVVISPLWKPGAYLKLVFLYQLVNDLIVYPIMDVSNHWTGIWNGTMDWKMEWNSEHTKLQLSHVTGSAQSRLSYLVYL